MSDLYIDVGSTNVKYRSVDDLGGVTEGSETFPKPCINDGIFYEVKLSDIDDVLLRIVEKSTYSRIFISTQMHGYVLKKGDKFITEYISWRDKRGAGLCKNFALPPESGESVKPNLPPLSARVTLEKLGLECGEDLIFFTLGSYVSYLLTGINATHITDAAASGFFNVVTRKKGEWVDFDMRLPKVYYEVKAVGRYNGALVFSPFGDQQCAVFGSGASSDEYILNLGTAAQMCCVENQFVSGNFESRPFFGGKTLCTVTGLIGGAYIERKNDEELYDSLIEEYSAALKKLPAKKELLITGGVVRYRQNLIEKVADGLKVKYRLNDSSDALCGLELIGKKNKSRAISRLSPDFDKCFGENKWKKQ